MDLHLLRERLSVEISNIDEFEVATFFDTEGSFVTQVVPYNIAASLDRYAGELYDFLLHSFWGVIQRKFGKRVDYKKKYSVPSDPVLPASELVRCGQPLADISTGKPPTLKQWQEMVSDIV